MPQTDSDREDIVIALLLDGKGSAIQAGWHEVEGWKPEHGALWLQLDKTSSRTRRDLLMRAPPSKTGDGADPSHL